MWGERSGQALAGAEQGDSLMAMGRSNQGEEDFIASAINPAVMAEETGPC